MDSQSGQAAVEWVVLLLLVSAALGALLALAPTVEGRGLGGAIAHAITCTAGGRCEAAAAGAVAGSVAPGSRVAAPPPPRLSMPRVPVSPDRAAAAYQVLRGLKRVAGRAWIACLGYKRFQYERAHPEFSLSGRMPVREAMRIANACLNPAEFVGEEG